MSSERRRTTGCRSRQTIGGNGNPRCAFAQRPRPASNRARQCTVCVIHSRGYGVDERAGNSLDQALPPSPAPNLARYEARSLVYWACWHRPQKKIPLVATSYRAPYAHQPRIDSRLIHCATLLANDAVPPARTNYRMIAFTSKCTVAKYLVI